MNALIYMLPGFLKENNVDPAKYRQYSFDKAHKTWEGVKGKSAKEIARIFANVYSIIVDKLKLKGEENEVYLIMEGWPNEDSLKFFGISKELVLDMWLDLPKPYENYLGMQFEAKKDDKIILTFRT